LAQKQFFSGVATFSASALTNVQTSITGQSTATWSSVGDYIVRIDGFAPGTSTAIFEDVLVTANNTATGVLTVTRNQDGTGAQAFAAGATLTPVISLKMITDAMARLDANGIQLPTTIGGTLPTSGYGTIPVKIDDILVGTDTRYLAATAQITFLNTSNSGTNLLPTGFRHLVVEWYARGDTAATNTAINARLNNISTATYNWEYGQIFGGSTQLPVESLGATGIVVGFMPAATATANYFGVGTAQLKYYQGLIGNKVILADSSMSQSDSSGGTFRFLHTGVWRTAGTAVTRLDLLPSAGSFIVGSQFTLWGYP
jgi:hypothetical protein